MQITYQLEEKDYIRFNQVQAWRSPTMKKSIWRQRILGPVLFLVFPLLVAQYSDIPLWYWYSIFGLLSLAWFAFYPRYINWEIGTRTRKLLQEVGEDKAFLPVTLALEDQGLREKSAMGQSFVNWQEVQELLEGQEAYYLYISAAKAYILPKRVVGEAQGQPFLSRLKEILGEDRLQTAR